jgi:hypothetical protein
LKNADLVVCAISKMEKRSVKKMINISALHPFGHDIQSDNLFVKDMLIHARTC